MDFNRQNIFQATAAKKVCSFRCRFKIIHAQSLQLYGNWYFVNRNYSSSLLKLQLLQM